MVAQHWLAHRLADSEHQAAVAKPALVWVVVLLTGIYGGYVVIIAWARPWAARSAASSGAACPDAAARSSSWRAMPP